MSNNYYKYQLLFFQKMNSLDLFKSYYTCKLLYHELINEINNFSSSDNSILNNLQILDLFLMKFNSLKNISQNIYVFFKLLHIILDINNNVQSSLNNEQTKKTLKILSETSNKSTEYSDYLSEIPKESYKHLYNNLNEINEIYQKLYILSTKYENYNYNVNIIYERLKLKDLNELINIPFNLKPMKEYLKNNDNKQNILIVFNIIKETIKNILDIKRLKIDLKNYYNYTNQIFDKYLFYLNTIKNTIQIPEIIKSNIMSDIDNINTKRNIWTNRINKYYEIIYNSIISIKIKEPVINQDNTKNNNQLKENIKETINQQENENIQEINQPANQIINNIQELENEQETNQISNQLKNNIKKSKDNKQNSIQKEPIISNEINQEINQISNQISKQLEQINNSQDINQFLIQSSNPLVEENTNQKIILQKQTENKKEINKKDFPLRTVIDPIKLYK